MDRIELEKRADMIKAISHPDRLCIVFGLCRHQCNVGQIQNKLGLSQSGLSQHLAKLKAAGIIRGERNGKQICYHVVDGLAIDVVELVFICLDMTEEDCF